MKLLPIKVIGFFLLFSNQSLFAFSGNEALDNIQKQSSSSSPHDTIKELYESSYEPANIEDIPMIRDSRTTLQCRIPRFIGSKVDNSNLRSFYIRAIEVKKNQNNGPLFPEYTERYIVTTAQEPKWTDFIFYEGTEAFQDGYDLISKIINEESSRFTTYQKIKLRKNGDLIAFKLTDYKQAYQGELMEEDITSIRYGYCWN